MNYNTLTREQRKEIVERIRLDIGPEPVPLDESTPERLAETFIERYYFRTDLFSREQFGVELDEWQREVALDVDAGEPRISVRACHNVGKSMTFAIIAAKFLLTRWRCKIVLTAPSATQLFDTFYAELKSLLRRMDQRLLDAFEIKSDRIEMKATPEDAFLSVRTSSKDRPEAMQGVHSDFVLLIPDEASGVDDVVFESAGGSLAGDNCTLLMASNPTRLSGFFADSQLKRGNAERYKRYHISKYKYEGPDDGVLHYVSSRITDDFEQQKLVESNGDKEHYIYRVRVLGEFPKGDKDSFISKDTVLSAFARDITPHENEIRLWSVDPARFGDDGTALAKRHGRKVYKPVRKTGLDTMQVAGWIKNEFDSVPQHQRPREILIDVIGIGAGVYDRLNEQGLPVRAVNVAESPTVSNKYMRLRDEVWGRTKDALDSRTFAFEEDNELLEDLCAPRYTYHSNGRLEIESKKSMRSRGVPSPDKGDAVCMLFLDDYAIHGEATSNRNWNEPLERNLHAVL